MVFGRLIRTEDNKCLVSNASRTTNFLERMRGLLFKPPLKDNEALLIMSCNSIHMIGMSYAIDAIFLDKNWVVLKCVEELQPWQLSVCIDASLVVELPKKKIQQMAIKKGQLLKWDSGNEK